MKSNFLLHVLFLGCLLLFSEACTSQLDDPKTKFPGPTDLKIEKLSATSAKLTWKDNSKGEDGFVIERVITGTTDTIKNTVGSNDTEWDDKSLSMSTYRYTVYAYYGKRKSSSVSLNYQHIPVVAPANLQLNATGSGNALILTWQADNTAIDGFMIERRVGSGSFQILQTVDKSTFSYTDNAPATGNVTYRIYAFSGKIKSESVEKTIVYIAQPQITINNLISSYCMITPYLALISDGGADCTTGICWSKSPSPTLADNVKTFHSKLSGGSSFYIPADNLNENDTYYFRAFATNSNFTSYSNEVSGKLSAQPAAINLTWTPVTDVNTVLPSEIKVYETSTQLSGRNFKAYYAIADMSTGNIELKTIFSSTAKKPSAHIAATTNETIYVMTNGGYFGYNGSTAVSYSLVMDRGSKLADNIASLTRGNYVYSVTRGAFGVTAAQVPSVKWAVGNFVYDHPSQNIEGEIPQPAASSVFPGNSVSWNAYTAIGGAPVLIKDGKIMIDFTTTFSGKYLTNYELLQTDIFGTTVRPPRTVIGSTADNKLILFICDGRQTHSDGATLTELAQIMKGLGCVNALNLDGGGSTAMIAGGTLLNKPSDGTERAVPSVVAFVKKK
jgi:hypothetical protein